jgi:hypothetical protein
MGAVLAQQAPDDALALAVAVHLGGVQQRDTGAHRRLVGAWIVAKS